MEITRTEQVTRKYCDVCGIEVTHANNCGSYNKENPQDDYTVCMKYDLFKLDMNSGESVRLSCETLARLYSKYPELANNTFINRNFKPAE